MENFNPVNLLDEVTKRINTLGLEVQELLAAAQYKNGVKDTLVSTRNLLQNTIEHYDNLLNDKQQELNAVYATRNTEFSHHFEDEELGDLL